MGEFVLRKEIFKNGRTMVMRVVVDQDDFKLVLGTVFDGSKNRFKTIWNKSGTVVVGNDDGIVWSRCHFIYDSPVIFDSWMVSPFFRLSLKTSLALSSMTYIAGWLLAKLLMESVSVAVTKSTTSNLELSQIISRGILVSFIQKGCLPSRSKTKSMPQLEQSWVR